MKCSFCNKDVNNDIGHYDAVDENKTMCIKCYKKIVLKNKNDKYHGMRVMKLSYGYYCLEANKCKTCWMERERPDLYDWVQKRIKRYNKNERLSNRSVIRNGR